MKAISGIVTSFLMISLVAQVTSAACLDRMPINQKELDQRIRVAKMQYAEAQDMEKNYGQLAQDVKETSASAKFMASVGVAPITAVLAAQYGFASAFYNGDKALLVAAVTASAISGYSWVHVVKELKTIFGFSDIQINEMSKALLAAKNDGEISCSFDELNKKLVEDRNKILDEDMSGSVYQATKNSVMLGQPYANATLRLYAIAALQKKLRSSELKELSDVRFTSTTQVGSSAKMNGQR